MEEQVGIIPSRVCDAVSPRPQFVDSRLSIEHSRVRSTEQPTHLCEQIYHMQDIRGFGGPSLLYEPGEIVSNRTLSSRCGEVADLFHLRIISHIRDVGIPPSQASEVPAISR